MKNYWLYYILAILCLILAFISPIFFTWRPYTEFGTNSAFIGDTIGGLTAPFLSVAGSILVFAALRAQIEANQKVQEQFEKQQIETNKKDLEQTIIRCFDLHQNIVESYKIHKQDLFKDLDNDIFLYPSYSGPEYGALLNQKYNRFPDFLEGQQVFESTNQLFEWAMFDGSDFFIKKNMSQIEVYESIISFFYYPMENLLFRYYNNVFMTMNLINNSIYHNKEEKEQWFVFYLNHFTYSEIKWLFWISFKEEYIQFHALLDKYKCFDRINYDDLTTKAYWDFPEQYKHLKRRFDKVRTENGSID